MVIASVFILSIASMPAAHAEVRIGIGGPLPGPDATFGAQLRMGVEQAVEGINASGVILGQQLIVAAGDDAADPKQGVSLANKFVGDEVSFVVGHFNLGAWPPRTSRPLPPIRSLPSAASTRCFAPAGATTSKRSWRRGSSPAKKASQSRSSTTKALTGKGLAEETRKDLEAMGIKAVLYECLNKGEKDYSAIVSKIKASQASSSIGGASIPRRDCWPDARSRRERSADGGRWNCVR